MQKANSRSSRRRTGAGVLAKRGDRSTSRSHPVSSLELPSVIIDRASYSLWSKLARIRFKAAIPPNQLARPVHSSAHLPHPISKATYRASTSTCTLCTFIAMMSLDNPVQPLPPRVGPRGHAADLLWWPRLAFERKTDADIATSE